MPFEDDELDEFSLLPGDVLICEGGEPGRSAVWDGRESDLYFQKALHRVRLFEWMAPQFLVLYLRSSADAGRLVPYSTGETFQHLTGQSLAGLLVPIPPVAEQHRIVAKVDELMVLCDDLELALASAEGGRGRVLDALLREVLEPAGARWAHAGSGDGNPASLPRRRDGLP
jgi:type I restriction enzyme S subunit